MNQKENEVSAQVVGINTKLDYSGVKVWGNELYDYVTNKFKVGESHKVTVTKLPEENSTVTCVEVSTEENLKGVIELEDFYWNLHSPSLEIKEGDEIELIVKYINKFQSVIEFTRLDEKENPWGEIVKEFTTSSVHEGTVMKIGNNGAIIHLEYNKEPLEAFIRVFTTTEQWVKDLLVEGKKLNFTVQYTDKDKREVIVTLLKSNNLEAVAEVEAEAAKAAEKKEQETLDESERIKQSIKTKYFDRDFIYDIMSVPSHSTDERRMQLYILNWARSRGIDVQCDKKGNLYLTKGKLENGEVYPCVTSHMDTVQEKAKVYSDAGARLEIITTEEKVYSDKDKAFYGGDVKHKIAVDGQGIGADCKAGLAISLALMDKFDKMKAAFFVEEEIGMVGSKSMDASFFDDCGYCIGWDSPDLNRAAWKSSGTKLFSAEFYQKFLKPVCDKWGLTDFRSEPFTDIINIREKSKLMCMNFGNGGYNAHLYTEYCIVEDMDHALGMGIEIVETLGNKLYKTNSLVGKSENNMLKESEADDDKYFSKTFNSWSGSYGGSYGGYSNNYSSNRSTNGTTTTTTKHGSTTDKVESDSGAAVKYVIETYDAFLEARKKDAVELLKKFCEDNGLDYETQLSASFEAVYSKEIKF